jgi:lysophospholipase L1-like esterase
MILYDGNDVSYSTGASLADKKVLIIGDSISTDAYGNYKKWVTNLIENGFFDSDKVTNSSYHATGFVATYSEGGSVVSDTFKNRLQAISGKSSYDLVITFGGINDYIQGIDFDTFKSAVDSYFEYLVKNFVQARIVVITPLRTYNVYKNTAVHFQTEYSDYIKGVAKSYCLPVLNLTEDSGYYPFVDEFKQMWTLTPSGFTNPDGVHPTAEYSAKYLAPMIAEYLVKTLYSDSASGSKSDDPAPTPESNVFLVTVTMSNETSGMADKSYAEVIEAWNAGKTIRGYAPALNGEIDFTVHMGIGTEDEMFVAVVPMTQGIAVISMLKGLSDDDMMPVAIQS